MNIFLATTALEEFWEQSKPIVLLGPWCRADDSGAQRQLPAAETLDPPFRAPGAVRAAYASVSASYERMLPLVASALNALHGERHSVRYWRIVAGPWLHVYLSVIHDRYTHLKHALATYPALTTIGLDEAAHVVVADTQDFASYLLEDTFNLQIYTKILDALGYGFPTRGAGLVQNAAYVKAAPRTWKQRAIRRATTVYARTAARVFPSLVLKDSYFPKSLELGFALNSPGKILPVLGPARPLPTWSPRKDLRDQLQAQLQAQLHDNEFERCVGAMLWSDVPLCFVEGYASVAAAAAADYPAAAAAVFSANAWYYDEVFKQWAAARSESGARLLGIQHGGNYGALAMMPSEEHETSIVDRYYSWGWEAEDRAARVIPMPASKLMARQPSAPEQRQGGGLWVATMAPRYLVQFPWVPVQFEEYMDWQHRFASALTGEVAGQIRLRPHREDNGWGLVPRFRAAFPKMQVEGWETTFQDSVRNCRLYICDHLSTTFIEALATNTPTILFWNPEANELRPEAQAYYDFLTEHGVLFSDPESAAHAVNRIFDDVAAWWNEAPRQRAVAAFCARFARTSDDAQALWNAEFRRVAAPAPLTDRR